MQTYEIVVRGRSVRPNSDDMTLVRTSVGIDRIHVLFDDAEWLGFPVTITFAQGESVLTQALAMAEVSGSDEWVAEAYATVPWEVILANGPIRVTLQGTDSDGRHIITAAGSPLSVEEAGDVAIGEVPSDAPTVDQWHQAYADAVTAANEARGAASALEARIEEIVSAAETSLEDRIAEVHRPATAEELGSVIVGEGLEVSELGRVSVMTIPGITDAERSQLRNLAMLASYCFNATFDREGNVEEGARLKSTALPRFPVATVSTPGVVMPDGISVTVNEAGLLSFIGGLVHEWEGTTLKVTSAAGTSSVDLIGPRADIVGATADVNQDGEPGVEVEVGGTPDERTLHFAFTGIRGERGPQGIQGPAGYVLTEEDIETISDEILSRYALADSTRY